MPYFNLTSMQGPARQVIPYAYSNNQIIGQYAFLLTSPNHGTLPASGTLSLLATQAPQLTVVGLLIFTFATANLNMTVQLGGIIFLDFSTDTATPMIFDLRPYGFEQTGALQLVNGTATAVAVNWSIFYTLL